jgi:hypothetical protein
MTTCCGKPRNGFHRASVYRALQHDLVVVLGDTNSRLVLELPEGEMPKGPPEAWLLCDELSLGEDVVFFYLLVI